MEPERFSSLASMCGQVFRRTYGGPQSCRTAFDRRVNDVLAAVMLVNTVRTRRWNEMVQTGVVMGQYFD